MTKTLTFVRSVWPHSYVSHETQVWESFVQAGGLDARVLGNMKIIRAGRCCTDGADNSVPGKVTAQMQIEKHHTNRLEILHGGTISTMIDLGGYSHGLVRLTGQVSSLRVKRTFRNWCIHRYQYLIYLLWWKGGRHNYHGSGV